MKLADERYALGRELGRSVMLAYDGQFDAALPLAQRPIELDPQFPEGYHIGGYVHLGRKDFPSAHRLLTRAVELSHRASWPMAKLGCALVGLGLGSPVAGTLKAPSSR